MTSRQPKRASPRKLVTISVAAFNEAQAIPALIARLEKVTADLPAYDFELLFVDDGSSDETWACLAEAARKDPRIRVIRLSRNFGFQRALLTNYLNARGDAAIQLDADLQDPPEMIGEFLRLWEAGYSVVYGIRDKRTDSLLMTWLRNSFYRIIDRLSDITLPPGAGDFRLIDRKIIEYLRQHTDRSPYVRGMVAAAGYQQVGIHYDRSPRVAGRSKIGPGKALGIAIDGICSHSTRPLRLITYFGIATSAVTALMAVFYIFYHFAIAETQSPGFTTLVLLLLLSLGVNASALGILGEYLGRIYNNVRGEPISVVQEEFSGEPEAPKADKNPCGSQAR